MHQYANPAYKHVVNQIARKAAQEILNKWDLQLKGQARYDEEYDPEESGYVSL
jgi:hypothetical protein